MRAIPSLILTACLAMTLAACGLTVPSDPDGTLQRVRDHELRAGASPSGDLVMVKGEEVSGSLAELVEGFAQSLDATVVWTVGSEEDLVDDLETGALDLAIGGMTDQTPWVDRVAVTRGFPGVEGAGDTSIVMLLPMGENAWQTALETYLDEELTP